MPKGLIVSRVEPGSLVERAGLREGDEVIAVDGQPIRDVIDYRFCTAEESFEIAYRRGTEGHVAFIERDYSHPLGLDFQCPTSDGIRRCSNGCDFCFISQMPPGLRRSLYVRDDDYRYSFIFGNFITLTNLRDEDWQRIQEQHLSPLYVSVHTTDPKQRMALLRNPNAPDILSQLRRLQRIGVEMHTQIVLCPGMNDGPAMEKTITDLGRLWPAVRSVAIVPVGVTRYQHRGIQPVSTTQATELVRRSRELAAHYRRELGIGLVYLSDELYLLANEPLPACEEYDGYPQLENGVGMLRLFLDQWLSLSSQPPVMRACAGRRVTLVTGTLFASTLQPISEQIARRTRSTIRVRPIVNRFFGPAVTVAGLLTAKDVVAALRDEEVGDLLILPGAMFDASGARSLDDCTTEEISEALGEVHLAVASTPEQLLKVIGEMEA